MNFKMIITIALIGLIGFLAFGLFQASKLTHIHINKQTLIEGSEEEVFDMISHLSNYPKWSPFLEADPSQEYHVTGADGEVGVQFHWEGSGGKDIGYQEIVKIEEPGFVGVRCVIDKPFKATPTFDYSIQAAANGVVVSQDFNLSSGLADAFFMWLFGAKEEMAKVNERGLELLKRQIEV